MGKETNNSEESAVDFREWISVASEISRWSTDRFWEVCARIANTDGAGPVEVDKIAWICFPASGFSYCSKLLSRHPEIYSLTRPLEHSHDSSRLSGKKFLAQIRKLEAKAADRVLSFPVYPELLSRIEYVRHVLADRKTLKVVFRRDLLGDYLKSSNGRYSTRRAQGSEADDAREKERSEIFQYLLSVGGMLSQAELFLMRTQQPYGVCAYEDVARGKTAEDRLRAMIDEIVASKADLGKRFQKERDELGERGASGRRKLNYLNHARR
ncbi:hypothetical protein [Pelagicoccus sp. SDUM812003]|uniref:hypothetical protein n=1 Tax=Pelagicoccus sp. SDUM812003 TaxID=3041267 RepID=UPI00280C7798|nr:hypothetical protein [Pelagicoccus sp. SDUM812003]MDQ8203609.1 hypothetical protein [Pelagicoccus sp. SDUM812003]